MLALICRRPLLLLLRLLRTGAGLCALAWALQAGAQSSVRNEQVQVTLLAHAPQGVQAGQTFWLGLRIEHAPHWHTYWKNPGDSGLPTQLSWKLPAGLQAGELRWPLPQKIPIGDLANYGYEGRVLLATPITVGPQFQPPPDGKLPIAVQAQWLVCRQECIPQEARLTLTLPSASASALYGPEFEAARAASPQVLAVPQQAQISADGQHLSLRVAQLPADWRGQTLSLFPITPEVVHNAAAQGQGWQQQWDGDTWSARVPVSEQRGDSPAQMQWVLALGPERQPRPPAVQISTPLQGQWPALPASATVSPALAKALEAQVQAQAQVEAQAQAPTSPASAGAWALALLGALLGGLILNLMPCVFPVLAIKVLAFAQHSGQATQHRRLGLAYTAGVVLSFVALGAALLALRSAGEAIGWGFQLQNPLVVAALALLFTLIGLNLAGLFELGMLLPSRLASLQARSPSGDAFLTGVLAVAIASPCTAPFMGASLGLAIALPAVQALAVFALLGLGMALPYLAASCWPALARALPRPGAWMNTFRQLMAFPMLATVVWLLWVLGQQNGVHAVASLLLLLLAVAWLIWALRLRGKSRLWLGGTAALVLLWLLLRVGPYVSDAANPLPEQAPTSASMASGSAVDTSDAPGASGKSSKSSGTSAAHWQAWSPERQAALLAQGRAVFVDYTAAWCVTCQFNKLGTLSDPSVLADLAAHNVALLRADWTRRDPQITAELAKLGRSGVPVYTLLAPGQKVQVLSEVLSPAQVRAALAQLPRLPPLAP